MSTFGNIQINGRATQSQPAQNPNDLIRLGEAQQLLRTQLAGGWNNATTFTQGMLVTDDNGVWLLQAATSLNQKPADNPGIWTLVLAGGVNGVDGQAVWFAFASDNAGTGFSLTPGSGLTYIGFGTGATQPNTVGGYSGWTKFVGTNGSSGSAGTNGTSSWFAFASGYDAGTGVVTNFNLSPTGQTFIGFGTGATQPTSAAGYSGWTQFVGTNGNDGATGAPGAAGAAAYLCVVYSSGTTDSDRLTNLSVTPNTALDFIAFQSTAAPITSAVQAQALTWTGLWKQYGSAISSVTSPLTLTGGALGINAASDNTASYVVQRDASGNFTAGTVTLTAVIIGSATLNYSSSALQINTALTAAGPLTISNLTTGVLLANSSGVVSSGATSNDMAEGTVNLATPTGNAYFTRARVLATPLTGYTTAAGSPVLLATDTVLAALGKLDAALVSGGNFAALTGATFTGAVTLAQTIQTSGSPNLLVLTGAAHTTLAGGTEASDAVLNFARTVQFNTGALTLQRTACIAAPTYAFVAASTLTTAVTLDISGAPVAGTNATVTNAIGFKVGGGAVGSGTVNAYGLFVDAPTGATNNYAAAFNTGDVLLNAGWLKAATGYGLKVNGAQVLTNRQTGWTAATGTAARTSFDTSTVTLPNLAQAVKALIDDLMTHGLIGT